MSQSYDFLHECGVFYLSTINGDAPETRPFGAIMERDGALYFSTAHTKSVYAQIKANPHIQIVALKPNTRQWMRLNGKAMETNEITLKQAMLDACPVLQKRFVADSSHYALFKITDKSAVLMSDSGSISMT